MTKIAFAVVAGIFGLVIEGGWVISGYLMVEIEFACVCRVFLFMFEHDFTGISTKVTHCTIFILRSGIIIAYFYGLLVIALL